MVHHKLASLKFDRKTSTAIVHLVGQPPKNLKISMLYEAGSTNFTAQVSFYLESNYKSFMQLMHANSRQQVEKFICLQLAQIWQSQILGVMCTSTEVTSTTWKGFITRADGYVLKDVSICIDDARDPKALQSISQQINNGRRKSYQCNAFMVSRNILLQMKNQTCCNYFFYWKEKKVTAFEIEKNMCK